MNPTNRIIAALLVISFLSAAPSCKKSSGGGTTSTDPASAIVGKWHIVTYIETVTTHDGHIFTDTTRTTHADYLDFAANGLEYSNTWYDFTINSLGSTITGVYASSSDYDFSADTTAYRVSGNQLFFSANNVVVDTVTIKTITSDQLTLYGKETDTVTYGVPYTLENWRFLSK